MPVLLVSFKFKGGGKLDDKETFQGEDAPLSSSGVSIQTLCPRVQRKKTIRVHKEWLSLHHDLSVVKYLFHGSRIRHNQLRPRIAEHGF